MLDVASAASRGRPNEGGIPSGSVVKNPPAIQETWVQSLGREDPLEKEMATHSSILAWETQGRGSLVGCHLWGRTESDTTEVT